MTEQEWMASEDPAAMLRLLMSVKEDLSGTFRPSDRKLRLWVEACRTGASVKHIEFDIHDSQGLQDAVGVYATSDLELLSFAERAALLRCIAGNHYRPVTLPKEWTCRCETHSTHYPLRETCATCGAKKECPWLTPTVISLAQAAYDERAWWKCPECEAKLCWAVPHEGAPTCDLCHGTGRIGDGSTLDPVRLAVLADALEEAGCEGGEACLCDGGWLTSSQGERIKRYRCDVCGGAGRIHRPHPLLAHLRSEGPHVCGCHAIDTILGKE